MTARSPQPTLGTSVTTEGATAGNVKRDGAGTRTALIWAFTASLAAGAVIGSLALMGWGDFSSPIRLPWPVLAVAFALGHFAAIRLEYRNETHSLNLADAFILPAIAFTSIKGVVLAVTAGYLVRAVWVRQSLIKAAFNLALHAFVAVVALFAYRAVIGDQSVLSARGWLAGAVAILTVDLISSGAIQLVVGLSAGRGALTGLRRFSATVAITLVAEATIGLVAVHMITSGAVPAALFAVTAVTIAFGYVVHGRLRDRHGRLTQLYRFDRALAGLAERGEVIDTVLTGMINLLNAAEAQLITAGPRGLEYHTVRSGDDVGVRTGTSTHPLAGVLPSVERTTRVTRHTAARGLGAALQKAGLRDAIIAPIGDQPHPTEWLVVADRLGGHHVTFQDADVELLDALSVAVAMALRSSRLLDQLRAEVAAKEHQAHHDGLTGLPNRTLYTAALDEAMAERAPDAVVGVLLMDLDGFKSVNDTMGHDVGDLLLQQLAARLKPVVANKGLIARLGGDEFAVVVPAADDIAELELLAETLAAAAETTATVGGTELRVEASVGVSAAPEHGQDRSTLLRRADTAMYQAKRQGMRVAVYDPGPDPGGLARPSLVSALREAVDARALELAYQPKADLQTGRVVGVEALLRWRHPIYGDIEGAQAIPVAERSGLIRTVTRWALDTSLAQLRRWQHDHDLTLGLAVNLSPLLLADEEIVGEVVALLRAHGIAPASLTLELTESVSAGRLTDDAAMAIQLANHGVRLSIDDFGTGASSLARLNALPVHELKIDRSFIGELDDAASTAAIVGSTVEMAHRLGIDVVAEGVETRGVWRRLRHMRCDYAQGYLLSPPLRATELLAWLLRRAAEQPAPSNVIPFDTSYR